MVLSKSSSRPAEFWWSNALFFVGTHVAGLFGVIYWPVWSVPKSTVVLAVFVWQAACFGITIGYHRLYSHRAFRASFAVRLVLAALGSMAFQGSIKWWSLRHRLHHRFTDDLVHDPYSATRGLLFSHVGWIFYKPTYDKLEQIERNDLEKDPVVRFQHRYYVPLALFFGLLLPTLIGWTWNDPYGAFVWGGLVSRLAIWHCTFLVNSLAHWDGLQPYSDENTSRGNILMAVLTCGEGNHNFHAFPQDFRAGPSALDWDPSKWIILLLHKLGLASGLRRAREEDIRNARTWMHQKLAMSDQETSTDSAASASTSEDDDEGEWAGDVWDDEMVRAYVGEKPGQCVIVIDGYAVDATAYLGEHPGGATLLQKYAIREDIQTLKDGETNTKPMVTDASWAFNGGLNKHSRAARRRLNQLRVAKVSFSKKL